MPWNDPFAPQIHPSPDYAEIFVTKCRRRRDDKACEGTRLRGSGPAGVLMQYAEEPKRHPLAGRGTRLRVAQSAWMIAALQ